MSQTFSFSKETNWPKKIKELRSQGAREVEVPVYWGAHEQVRGICDFSKLSSLRLEKLLGMLTDEGLGVHLTVGFPAAGPTFPQWAWDLPLKASVPLANVRGTREFFQTSTIPSLDNIDLQAGLLSYLNELLEIAALYVEPDGCVESIFLDFRIFENQLNLSAHPQFLNYWEREFGSIEQINSHFQTSFRSMEALKSKSSLHLLYKKRPWHFALEYKKFQRSLIEDVRRDLLGLGVMQALLGHQKTVGGLGTLLRSNRRQPLQILFDPILLGHCRESIAPFIAEELLTEKSLDWFRLCDSVAHQARGHQVAIQFLPTWKRDKVHIASDLTIVMAGRFLSSYSVRYLQQYVSMGNALFFPLGLPSLNEKLEPIEWGSRLERVVKEKEQLHYRLGEGRMVVPSVAWAQDETFMRKLETFQSVL